MTITLLTPAAEEPITLAQAKAQCVVEHSLHDDLIALYISSARAAAEHILGRALVERTWRVTLDAFSASPVDLDRRIATGVASVAYVDAADAPQTVDPATYTFTAATWTTDARGFPVAVPARLSLASGAAWPTDAKPGSVTVDFTTGYGPAADVPADVRHWMLLQIAAAYRNREAFAAGITVTDLPNRFVDRLLDAERLYV